MPPRYLLCFVSIVLLTTALARGQAALVKDINPVGASNPPSDPKPTPRFDVVLDKSGKYVNVGKWTYFVASTVTVGTELHRTDGTTAGTQLVFDIRPGATNSSIREMVPFGGKLFFIAFTTAAGAEPYIHDPVTFKTTLIDLVSGTGSSSPQNPVAVPGGVCFQARTNSVYGLWFTDGTAVGTRKLPIPTTLLYAEPFAFFKGELYFRGRDGAGTEPWKTDGTLAGTTRLADLASGSNGSYPARPLIIGNKMYFVAETANSGREPFVTDGTTSGTRMIADVRVGSLGSNPDDFVAFGGRLYFVSYTIANGRELYWTDGTKVNLIDLYPGSANGVPSHLTVAGSNLWFRCEAPDPVTKKVIHRELWRFDGSKFQAYDINPSGNSDPSHLVAFGSDVICAADFAWRKGALYRASAGGITMLADLGSSQYNPVARYMTRLASGDVVFNAKHPTANTELWSTDGTAKGTGLLADIHPPAGTRDSGPIRSVSLGNRMFFLADDGQHGSELWVSDGTEPGTRLVFDMNPGGPSSGGSSLFAWGDTLLLAAIGTDPVTRQFIDNELWIVDARTLAVTAVDLWSSGASTPNGFCAYGGRVFFSARSSSGIELWVTDGTKAGTTLFKDINPGSSHSYPGFLTVYRGHLYFGAHRPNAGTELWRSDGTSSGTKMAVDVYVGASGSFPSHIAVAGDKLFFAATGDINQGGTVLPNDLWVSDGTPAGTKALRINTLRAADPRPGRFDGILDRLASFTLLGDKLLFTAQSTTQGREVHVTDGTAAGTFVIDADTTRSGVVGSAHIRAGDKLAYFVAAANTSDRELWVTDGTKAGSRLVKNIHPSAASHPRELAVLGDRAYFQADDGTHGPEPWTSDGTAAGTVMIQDMYPGKDVNGKPFGASPSSIHFADGRALFAGSSRAYGRELWSLDLDSYAQSVGTGCSRTRAPRLHMTRPVLGQSSRITVRHAAKNTTGLFVTGFVAEPPTLLGSGCIFYVNLALPIVLVPFQPDSAGSWTANVMIPNSKALKGRVHPAQAFVGPTGMQPFGVDASNGLYLNIDER